MTSNSKKSPSKVESMDTTLNSNQSLFMDESSEDLENYINTPLTRSSPATGDQNSYLEQDLECTKMNSLSRNIKGRFQKNHTTSRKNKFFKSKSLEEGRVVNSNEIPVINEAMKKILKETPYKPHLKHSPKALKTYSNKHKDKPPVVESFALPDEPFVELDTFQSTELDKINLEVKTEENSFDASFMLDAWIPPNSADGSEININEGFRKKCSTTFNLPFGGQNLESEVREGFNFEEDTSIQERAESSHLNTNKNPVVRLKPFNLNDIDLFESNDLSPLKNRKQLLFERLQKLRSNLNDQKLSDNEKQQSVSSQIKSSKVDCSVNKPNSRRITRSSNCSTGNVGDTDDENTQSLETFEQIQYSSGKVEKSNNKTVRETIENLMASPRRYTRSTNQNETTAKIKEDNSKISPTKSQRVSFNKCKKNEVKLDESPEKTNSSYSRDIRTSLRSSNASSTFTNNTSDAKKMNLKDDISNTDIKGGNTIQCKDPSGHTIEKESLSKTEKLNDSVEKRGQKNNNQTDMSSILLSKKIDSHQDAHILHEANTPTRKSKRQKLKSDEVSKVSDINSKSNENDADSKTSSNKVESLDSHTVEKKQRGRPSKKPIIMLESETELFKPSSNGKRNRNSNGATEVENEISIEFVGTTNEGENMKIVSMKTNISPSKTPKRDGSTTNSKHSNSILLRSESSKKSIENQIKNNIDKTPMGRSDLDKKKRNSIENKDDKIKSPRFKSKTDGNLLILSSPKNRTPKIISTSNKTEKTNNDLNSSLDKLANGTHPQVQGKKRKGRPPKNSKTTELLNLSEKEKVNHEAKDNENKNEKSDKVSDEVEIIDIPVKNSDIELLQNETPKTKRHIKNEIESNLNVDSSPNTKLVVVPMVENLIQKKNNEIMNDSSESSFIKENTEVNIKSNENEIIDGVIVGDIKEQQGIVKRKRGRPKKKKTVVDNAELLKPTNNEKPKPGQEIENEKTFELLTTEINESFGIRSMNDVVLPSINSLVESKTKNMENVSQSDIPEKEQIIEEKNKVESPQSKSQCDKNQLDLNISKNSEVVKINKTSNEKIKLNINPIDVDPCEMEGEQKSSANIKCVVEDTLELLKPSENETYKAEEKIESYKSIESVETSTDRNIDDVTTTDISPVNESNLEPLLNGDINELNLKEITDIPHESETATEQIIEKNNKIIENDKLRSMKEEENTQGKRRRSFRTKTSLDNDESTAENIVTQKNDANENQNDENEVLSREEIICNKEDDNKAEDQNLEENIEKTSTISQNYEEKLNSKRLNQSLSENSDEKEAMIIDTQFGGNEKVETPDEESKKFDEEYKHDFEEEKKIFDSKKSNIDSYQKVFTKNEDSFDNKIKLGEELKVYEATEAACIEPEFELNKVQATNINDEINCDSMDQMKKKVDQTASSCETLNTGEKTNTNNIEIRETNTSTVSYLDFGYDINRRTSFRKILERVMEASRLEMEMAKTEASRTQRCKSVPHEVFHRNRRINHITSKSFSADSKLKYLKDKRNENANIQNMEISKARKSLDFNPQSKFTMRKRAKSIHVADPDLGNQKTYQKIENGKCLKELNSAFGEIQKIKNNQSVEERKLSNSGNIIEVEEINGIEENTTDYLEKINTESKTSICSNGYDETKRNNSQNELLGDNSLDKRKTDDSGENILDQDDLEVESLLLGKSLNDSFERKRSKSFTAATRMTKTKSGLGKRVRKKSRNSGVFGQPSETSIPNPIKKVYEFKIGDSVWGKIGNYPYWPGLVVEDPETSDFKKFKLLRATPYYHIRFFGDNGKRAWTSYCIPYEGPDDLDKLREQSSKEGFQSSEFVVKTSHKVKWQKAVNEAEMVKKYPLDKKLGFFDQILPIKEINHLPGGNEGSSTILDFQNFSFGRARSKSFSFSRNAEKMTPKSNSQKIPMKESSILTCIENVVKNFAEGSPETKATESSSPNKKNPIKDSTAIKDAVKKSPEQTIKTPPSRKRSIPMKDNSVLSCIEDVVKKFCSPDADDSSEVSTRRRTQSRRTSGDSDDDLGLELLNVSAPNLSPKKEQKIDMKSPLNSSVVSPKTSTTGTPLSSRKHARISPKRTRSKSLIRLGKRRLSSEFKQDEETQAISEDIEKLCSPRRMKLKRRTIEPNLDIPASENIFLNNNRLSELKKNLFRGVTKEKVCQICEKTGDVVKCRGPCNGDFHIKCIENSLKETKELTEKETEDVVEKLKKKSEGPSSHSDEVLDNKQVQISTVVSRNKFADNVILSPINKKIPMMEQFDRKMKELMTQVESRISVESTDSSSEEIDSLERIASVKKTTGKNVKKPKGTFKHVTADDVCLINLSDEKSENNDQVHPVDEGVYKCPFCISTVIPPCFVCNSVVSKKGNTMRQRCSLQKCGRYYHLECLNVWHQTQWSFILHEKRKTEAFDSFVCPRHSCHICASENLGFSMGRCPNDKLVKCLRCPATYHNSYHCVPAGTDILTSTQIICPRHVEGNKKSNTLNTTWCFVCSEGGDLICCETCPTSVHVECLPVNLLEDDTYICEDCESGRFPLYDEVVWVKCGTFRWWPAIVLFPSEIPPNVESKPHSKGEFVVKFFGTYNYFWVGRGRTFLYQEGDTGYLTNNKNKIDEAFSRAIKEAADIYSFKKGIRAKKQKEVNTGLKPPPYVRIKVNRPVGNVKVFEGNLSNTTPCDCDPKDKSPCGPNSNCLNRILLTECNPEICPAGQRCKNQCFEKREYPQVVPYRTTGRGWGLKTLEPLKKGRFVIEYVGEIIDDEEYQRRITRMHQQKDENYYFLTIDKDRMLDAGPKGNVARFMNHSCQPNCETQKWTVNGDTRVGLFAIKDIPADSELTFNYNLECVGTEKKICRCGASNCSGFIGVKPEDQKSLKKNPTVKTAEPEKQEDTSVKDLCFICDKGDNLLKCSHKTCLKSYHLECVQLDSWPNGKWNCPAHYCNICSNRTARICFSCNNSYCPFHSEGNIRHDDSMGFLCTEHDQTKKKTRRRNTVSNGNMEAGSSNGSGTPQKRNLSQGEKNGSLRSERYRKRTGCFDTSNPSKRIKLDE